MEYREALQWIHGTYKFGSKLGLDNIRILLNLLDNPQKKLKFIHVAGTNGKGSTCSFIHSILKESGYKTGLFTSPFIENFTERIQIDYKEIPKNRLGEISTKVSEAVQRMLSKGYNHPTEFEIVTAIAFQYFFEERCDIVVLEVGLGGRYDSTNIIEKPILSVITSISMDHTDILGDTLTKIAHEKAGIIKPNTPVLLYPQHKESELEIKRIAKENQSKIIRPKFDLLEVMKIDQDGSLFSYDTYQNIKITLLGEHQIKNAVMAIETVNFLIEIGYNITEKAIINGLATAKWKGRLEILRKSPTFIIDGAHNKDGALSLTKAISQIFNNKKVIFIFGVMKDKEYEEMIRITSPYAKAYYIVTPDNNRALDGKILTEKAATYCNNVCNNDTIKKSVSEALEKAETDDIICAFGSLYYIGEVREMLLD